MSTLLLKPYRLMSLFTRILIIVAESVGAPWLKGTNFLGDGIRGRVKTRSIPWHSVTSNCYDLIYTIQKLKSWIWVFEFSPPLDKRYLAFCKKKEAHKKPKENHEGVHFSWSWTVLQELIRSYFKKVGGQGRKLGKVARIPYPKFVSEDTQDKSETTEGAGADRNTHSGVFCSITNHMCLYSWLKLCDILLNDL